MDQQAAGQAVFEMNVLENKLKQLDQQLGLVEQYIAESDKMEVMLEDFSKNDNVEIFVPLGTGMFTKGYLDKADKVLMSLGAGIVAEKDILSAKKLLEKRRSRFVEAREELANQVKVALQTITELDRAIKSQGIGHEHHVQNQEDHDHSGHDHQH